MAESMTEDRIDDRNRPQTPRGMPSLQRVNRTTSMEHGIFCRGRALSSAEGMGRIQGPGGVDLQTLRQAGQNLRSRTGRPDTPRRYFHPLEYRRRQRSWDKSGFAEIPLYCPRLALRTRVPDRCLSALRPDRKRRWPKHHRPNGLGRPTYRRTNHLPKISIRLTSPIRHRFSHPSSAIDPVICT